MQFLQHCKFAQRIALVKPNNVDTAVDYEVHKTLLQMCIGSVLFH